MDWTVTPSAHLASLGKITGGAWCCRPGSSARSLPCSSSTTRVAVVTSLAVVIANVPGAYSHNAGDWTEVPASAAQHPERLWDWRDPQFLASRRATR